MTMTRRTQWIVNAMLALLMPDQQTMLFYMLPTFQCAYSLLWNLGMTSSNSYSVTSSIGGPIFFTGIGGFFFQLSDLRSENFHSGSLAPDSHPSSGLRILSVLS